MVKEREESNAALDGDINDPMNIRLLLKVVRVKGAPTIQTHMAEEPWSGSRVHGQRP